MKSPSLENFQTKHRTLRQLEVFKYFRLDRRGCLGHGSPDVSHGWTVHSPLLGGATHSTSPPRLMGCGALFENPWARTAFFFFFLFCLHLLFRVCSMVNAILFYDDMKQGLYIFSEIIMDTSCPRALPLKKSGFRKRMGWGKKTNTRQGGPPPVPLNLSLPLQNW